MSGGRGSWLKLKSLDEVAEDLRVLAYVGAGVGSAVGPGVDPLPVEEVVFDEFEVGVLAEDLVVDVALSWRRG